VSTDSKEQLNSLENQVSYYDDYIKSNPNWEFCGGYIDEGLSGTSVDKRDDFLRMIKDGEAKMFDLVITKEISRFSRSTLDSIKYTQDLLDSGIGVFFQSDNINTLYSDSELRLTIMSSLAQDEMRRLSERVKFGMKRGYENGKVFGQSNIYGYDKVDGKLTINEKEAEFIRALFTLYAEGKYGYRMIANILTERGFRNQNGGELNPGTFKNILANPKYKGYYHGRKTESSDYRRKIKVKLAEEEHLLYKDENIPAIVSEDLWERVNQIQEQRATKFKQTGKGSIGVQNRFNYSGKIICEEHGLPHYRKVWKDRKIESESWCCRVYLAKGRKGCETPHLYTRDIEAILEHIGNDLLKNRERYVKSIDELIELYEQSRKSNVNFPLELSKISKEVEKAKKKQDKLLELYTDGDIEKSSYLESRDRLKAEIERQTKKFNELKEEQTKALNSGDTLNQVREFFMNFSDEGKGALEVARAMLESIVILRGSTKQDVRLRITMKYGDIIPCTLFNASKKRTNKEEEDTVILYADTEVSPVVGSERQSEELIMYLLKEFEENPTKIWESNIFGKSLHELVNEGLHNKLYRMPGDARMKLQETIQRIINDGCGGLICIIL
jgi:DNA invertase Pin-like site-specific DNA recombinase